MALTGHQIGNIADDAVNLHDALIARGVPKNAAYLVTYELKSEPAG